MAEFKIVLNHNINFAQMYRLMAMLSDAKIPFDIITFADGLQVAYPNNSKDRRCSVILHNFSYGHEYGFLEIMGLLTEEEACFDSVTVLETAEEVFERIRNDWEGHS